MKMTTFSQYHYIDSPETEQAIIQRFANLQRSLQDRNREEKLQEHGVREQNTKLFAPIIESNNRISERIFHQHNDSRNDDFGSRPQTNVTKDENFGVESKSGKSMVSPGDDDFISSDDDYYKRFFYFPSNQLYPKASDIDKNFGLVKRKEGDYTFAGKVVEVMNKGGAMVVKDSHKVFSPLSKGVWNLIQLNSPDASTYNANDLEVYGSILRNVGVREYVDAFSQSKKRKLKKTIRRET